MKHRLAPEAEADLLEIWLYVAEGGGLAIADRFVESLTARFFLLTAHPLAGRARNDLLPGLRSYPVGEYVVVYRVDGDDVLIQRVVRGSRDLDALLRE